MRRIAVFVSGGEERGKKKRKPGAIFVNVRFAGVIVPRDVDASLCEARR
jgi:hypothetical protein